MSRPSQHPTGSASRVTLLGCVALSGAAGLFWQVVWARQLALALGGTVPAAALVTGVFLGGLGVGARMAGIIGDHLRDPTRAYAACELAAAAWGLALIPVLSALPDLAPAGWEADANGWMVPTTASRIRQGILVTLLLGPPTALLGASLPLLAPPIVGSRVELAARRLAVLAAVNTGGAALGALSADLLVIGALGMRGAALVAAALGVTAALGAWGASWGGGVAAGAPADTTPVRSGRSPGSREDSPGGRREPAQVAAPAEGPADALPVRIAPALAFGLAGFAAMGLEMVWLRFLGSALGPYRAVFSVLLAVLLVGWLVGALVAGRLVRQAAAESVGLRGALPLFALAQASVATLSLFGLATHDPRALLVRQLASDASAGSQLAVLLATIVPVVLPAAVAMGAAFPLANAHLQRSERTIARTVGGVWLATTVGNAGGAVVTGLVLLPALGMQACAHLLAMLAAAAPLALSRRPVAWVGLLPILGFFAVPADHVLWASFPHGRAREEGVLAVDEGRDETIVVTGRPEGPARLWTNGHPMSSTSPGAQRYMRLFAHLPLLTHPRPERALVICFGVGNTLHAASLHPLRSLTLADLSPGVLSMAPWFAHANRNVLQDPRLTVYVDDGRRVLRTLEPGLDLVTLEPPPIAHAGVAALYTREFYGLVHDRLAEGGWIAQWLPAYQVPGPTVLALVRAFVDVFPDGALLVGDGRELLLVGVRGGAPTLDVDRVRARMSDPALAADLAAIGIHESADLAATFAAGGAHLRAVTAAVPAMTDDRPVAELGQVSHVARTELPSDLFNVAGWPAFAPALATDTALAERMRAQAEKWSSVEYRRYTTLPE